MTTSQQTFDADAFVKGLAEKAAPGNPVAQKQFVDALVVLVTASVEAAQASRTSDALIARVREGANRLSETQAGIDSTDLGIVHQHAHEIHEVLAGPSEGSDAA